MKLSQFIFEVIQELKKLPRDNYVPRASIWYQPFFADETKCIACLAGMYAGLKKWVKSGDHIFPLWKPEKGTRANLTYKQEQILAAINLIRTSFWEEASHKLGIQADESITDPSYPGEEDLPYPDTPDGCNFSDWPTFDKHLQSLESRANELQALGY